MRRAAAGLGALALSLGAAAMTPAAAASDKNGLAAFETVRAVLQNPRCQNCHIPGDAPLQFDAGLPHAMNVQRGPDGKGATGLACGTCHSASNPPASYGPHAPPGAPHWHLPPPDQKMVFIGLSAGDLCRTIKDPKKNGGRDFAALEKHVAEDKLVLWGWAPGTGREAVPIPHDRFVLAFRTWVEAGAPCPAP